MSTATTALLNGKGAPKSARIGVVVIGRNEGERLGESLRSVVGRHWPVVYVDSQSRDDSVARATKMGALVVEVSGEGGLTAARARNAGFRRLMQLEPCTEHVQFVDGDCEVEDDWIRRGSRYLDSHAHVGIVVGGVRERYPQACVYQELCDREWQTPVGELKYCGGVMLARASAFRDSGGFDEHLVAGEEPDLCIRLRRAGWRICRLPASMAIHDARMRTFGQWWRRQVRTGMGYAEGAWRYGRAAERHYVRELRSAILWGGLIPGLALGLSWLTLGWSLIGLLAYPLQWVRMCRREARGGRGGVRAGRYAGYMLLAKFAQMAGVAAFVIRALAVGTRARSRTGARNAGRSPSTY